MNTTVMMGEKEEALVSYQAALLDELTTRLSQMQIELGEKTDHLYAFILNQCCAKILKTCCVCINSFLD